MAITALRLLTFIGQIRRTQAVNRCFSRHFRSRLAPAIEHTSDLETPRQDAKSQRERELPTSQDRSGRPDQRCPGRPLRRTPRARPLGTVLEGPLTGEEVRPALPVVSPDPTSRPTNWVVFRATSWLKSPSTKRATLSRKSVVQSLAPAIDGKVLEALENWRFRPATRNGVAIASKQDVYYHFPRLGKG